MNSTGILEIKNNGFRGFPKSQNPKQFTNSHELKENNINKHFQILISQTKREIEQYWTEMKQNYSAERSITKNQTNLTNRLILLPYKAPYRAPIDTLRARFGILLDMNFVKIMARPF